MLNVIILSGVMLSVIMLSVIMLSFVMLRVVMLSVVMLSVVILSVVMLNVVMLSVVAPLFNPSKTVKTKKKIMNKIINAVNVILFTDCTFMILNGHNAANQ
jgi:hypothetical protein